jgi:hypothetical protein
MFNIFKKKTKKIVGEWEYNLLNAVINKLPLKYSFLNNQITSEFILDMVPNEMLGVGWKRMILNQNLYNSFRINTEINYKLSNIYVFDLIDKSYKKIELDLYEGIIIGYYLENTQNNMLFDLDNIDISNLKEIPYENIDKNELKKIMGKVNNDILNMLDVNSTFKIEIPEGIFYTIKDFGDGNYLSMNEKGSVFLMIHDPYEVKMLFENKDSFYKSLETGEFNFTKYY